MGALPQEIESGPRLQEPHNRGHGGHGSVLPVYPVHLDVLYYLRHQRASTHGYVPGLQLNHAVTPTSLFHSRDLDNERRLRGRQKATTAGACEVSRAASYERIHSEAIRRKLHRVARSSTIHWRLRWRRHR